MKKTLLTALAIIGITFPAHAERAVITGTLTIISNQFVVKTSLPLETEDDSGTIISSNKIQVVCDSSQIADLRALVGKHVMVDGEVFTAHTRYHIEPLLIDITDGDYMERAQ
jgi:FAD synthase